MVKDFFKDLGEAKGAEELVQYQLSRLMRDYTFQNVSDIPYYYHKGDIRAVDEFGNEVMIEVKCDSRIAQTRNILCEDAIYYSDTMETVPGNFHNDYEIYCVVSKSERIIYALDFAKMKRVYKQFRSQTIPHFDQTTYSYLLPLGYCKENNILIAEIRY